MSAPARTDHQRILLAMLDQWFGYDTAGAADLTGPELDAWLLQAEDNLFDELCAEVAA